MTDEAGEAVPDLQRLARRPGLIAVRGPKGIGRSRLLREFAEKSGAHPVAGLSLLVDIRHLALSRMVGDDLSTVPIDEASDRVCASVDGPLVIDDAQDVDLGSLAVLQRVAATRTVVIAWRTDAPLPFEPMHDLVLQPLTLEAAEALARANGADDPASVARRSGRVPGLLIDMCSSRDLQDHVQALTARLDAVGAPARQTLAAAHAVATAATEACLPPALSDDADALVTTGLISIVDGEIRLEHGLAGEVAWSALPEVERAAIHRQLATTSPNPTVVVRSLQALGDERGAVERARSPGPEADPRTTADLLAFVADHTERAEDHAAAAAAAVRFTDAARAVHHASAALGHPAAPFLLAQGRRLMGRIDLAHIALAQLADADMGVSEQAVTRELSQVDLRAEGSTDRLFEAGTVDGAGPATVSVLASLMAGQRIDRERLVERASATAADGDLDEAVLALAIALAGSAADDSPDLTGSFAHLVSLGRRTGAPLAMAVEPLRPALLLHVGQTGTGIVDELADLTGPVVGAHRAIALAHAGRTGEASTEIESDGWPDTAVWRATRWWLRAEVALLGGRLVSCTNAARAAVDAAPASLASVDLALLAGARAAFEAGDAPDRFEPQSFLAGPVQAELDALRSAAAGSSDAAERYGAAAESWTGRHHPAALRCRMTAAVLRPQGDDANAALLAVVTDAEALGYRVLAAVGRRDLRRRGLRTGSGSGVAAGGLSKREREVLALVGEGASSREIANRLGVAPSTVDTQVKSAMQKLGARTRLQAAALAAEAAETTEAG